MLVGKYHTNTVFRHLCHRGGAADFSTVAQSRSAASGFTLPRSSRRQRGEHQRSSPVLGLPHRRQRARVIGWFSKRLYFEHFPVKRTYRTYRRGYFCTLGTPFCWFCWFVFGDIPKLSSIPYPFGGGSPVGCILSICR